MPVCPIEYHTATFLGRLLDVIDGEIVPKTNAALQARITQDDRIPSGFRYPLGRH